MKKRFTQFNMRLILSTVMVFACQAAGAAYTPVTLTGFNADVVANGVGLPTVTTTQPFDAAASNPNYILIAQDYQATATSPLPTYFLPTSGTITSLATTGLSYQLAPYSGNNALRLTGTSAPANTGTLVFPTPNTYIGDIYVLGSTGSGTANATITINFTQGGTQTFTTTFNDWFNSTVVAVQGIGRADRTTGVIDAGAGSTNPRLYQVKVPLNFANYSKTIQSVTITRTGGSSTTSVLNIMAISVDHQTCLPTTSVAATGTTTTGTTLNWTAVTGSIGYEYALTTSSTPPASGTATTATSYSPTNLFPGTTYYMHVRNKCSATSFSIWNTISFLTLACPAAGTPTTSNNIPGSITITWPGTTTPGVTDYQYAVTGSTAAPTSWSTTTATTATVNGLTPGNTYYAHVRSNCTNTQAPWAASTSFLNPFPPCYAPAAMTISDINMHGANIVWNTSTGTNPQGYQYAVTTSVTPPSSGTATPDTFYSATALVGNTKYYVHVRTHCGSTNYSPWITDSFNTTAVCLSSNTPVITNVTANSADISWDPFPGIYGYEYFINTSPTAPTFAGMAINFNVIAPINLSSGTAYYFHLRTRCDTFNYSPWTSTPFTTLTVCGATSTPSLLNVTTTDASFSWTPVPGAQSYEYGVTTTSTPVPTGLFSSTPGATVMSLSPGTSYFFHVRVYCSSSDVSAWKSIAFSTTQTSVGTVNGGGQFNINAYPNPVGDILHIGLSGKTDGKGSLFLYDLSGKLIRQLEMVTDQVELNMSGLSQGMYLLRYRDNENVGTLRIQKQ